MNYFRGNRTAQTEPVDLDEQLGKTLTDRLRSVPPLERPAAEFAPPRAAPQRVEDAIEHIESFLALPLKEIDDALAAENAEHQATIALGQQIRDTIMAVRNDYLAQIARRRALTQIAKETFATLADKVAALDEPAQDQRPADATPEATEITADETKSTEAVS